MSATDELLRLRYELNVLADTWTKEAGQMDESQLRFLEVRDFDTAARLDAVSTHLRFRIQQLKDIINA